MPWKVSSEMDERLRFIARLLEGEAMTDRSRRPYRYANQLPPQIEAQIIGPENNKPHWGARKIRELLIRRLASEIKVPSRFTIHAVLDRNGLVRHMGRRRNKAHGIALSAGANPLRRSNRCAKKPPLKPLNSCSVSGDCHPL